MTMMAPSSDVAFTPAVKAVQERGGSRESYRRMEERGGRQTRVTPDLAAFLAERDSAYLTTATAAGQPYVQHRGGPKGFIRVLDHKTLGFADYVGNRQYISTGNLTETIAPSSCSRTFDPPRSFRKPTGAFSRYSSGVGETKNEESQRHERESRKNQGERA